MTYLNTWIERVRNTRSRAEQLIVHSTELCEWATILIETATDLCAMASRRASDETFHRSAAYRTAHPHSKEGMIR